MGRMAILLFVWGLSSLAQATEVVFCSDTRENEVVYDETSHLGLMALHRRVLKAAELAGLQAEFVAKPWLRCQKEMELNQVQGLFSMIETPQRSKSFAFPSRAALTDAYLSEVEYPIFVARASELLRRERGWITVDGVIWPAYHQLKHNGLSAPAGYVVYHMLKQELALSTIDYNGETGMKMVALKRLDGYVIERNLGLHLVNRLGLEEQISVTKGNVLRQKLHIPFNLTFYAQHPKKVESFWRYLRQLREAGAAPVEAGTAN